MKTFKRFFESIMIAVMVLSATSLSSFVGLDLPDWFNICASAAVYNGTCGENLTWTLDAETGELVIDGAGEMEEFENSAPWEQYWENIEKVTIKDGVTTISDKAFYGCSYVESVTIGDGVSSIGDGAFWLCEYLELLSIGKSVSQIGNYAFLCCRSINDINVDSENEHYTVGIDGVLFTKNKKKIVLYPAGSKRTNYEIPSGVQTIGAYSFRKSYNLKTVTIPDTVTRIENTAFAFCTSLESVSIPEGVRDIDRSAFSFCKNLKKVSIPSSVYEIGKDAFEGCYSLDSITVDTRNPMYLSMDGVLFSKDKRMLIKYPNGNLRTEYTVPNGVYEIQEKAFYSCVNLVSVSTGNDVAYIGDNAFDYSYDNLKNITLGKSVIHIGKEAFGHCYKLEAITVDKENSNYSSDMYGVLFNKDKTKLIKYSCGNAQKSYTIPDSVTVVDTEAFGNSKLENIIIGNSVSIIEEFAFSDCNYLKNVTIPKSVTEIKENSFVRCDRVESFTVAKGNPSYTSDEYGVMFNKDMTVLLYYPLGNKHLNYHIPDGVIRIGGGAFFRIQNLKSLIIPISMKEVAGGAFSGSGSLKNVYYKGTKEQWDAVSISWLNEAIINATIHFNYEYSFVIGDVNLDDYVNTTDALKCLQHTVGKVTLDDQECIAGDVDKNGVINSTDALKILRFTVGKIDVL